MKMFFSKHELAQEIVLWGLQFTNSAKTLMPASLTSFTKLVLAGYVGMVVSIEQVRRQLGSRLRSKVYGNAVRQRHQTLLLPTNIRGNKSHASFHVTIRLRMTVTSFGTTLLLPNRTLINYDTQDRRRVNLTGLWKVLQH